MFASLTVVALFIVLACLERSFLNQILEADLDASNPSWPPRDRPTRPGTSPEALSQDS